MGEWRNSLSKILWSKTVPNRLGFVLAFQNCLRFLSETFQELKTDFEEFPLKLAYAVSDRVSEVFLLLLTCAPFGYPYSCLFVGDIERHRFGCKCLKMVTHT